MTAPNHDQTVLGRQVDYSLSYDPNQLFPIPRELGRTAAGITIPASFAYGEDVWNIYELSWLSNSGKPVVAMAEVRVPWNSTFLIESKSLKLYCNSFNMTRFASARVVRETMARDLSDAAGGQVEVTLIPPNQFAETVINEPGGTCLDTLEIEDFTYDVDAAFLQADTKTVRETLFTRLFRSRCPVTGQPDWATVGISYTGPRISHEGLLRYLVSYREHQGFHEACVETIHADISRLCRPDDLQVSARFTRRGGIDINPVRSTRPGPWGNVRDPRQ